MKDEIDSETGSLSGTLEAPTHFPSRKRKSPVLILIRKCGERYRACFSWSNLATIILLLMVGFFIVDGIQYIDHVHGVITIDQVNGTLTLGTRGYCLDTSSEETLNVTCSNDVIPDNNEILSLINPSIARIPFKMKFVVIFTTLVALTSQAETFIFEARVCAFVGAVLVGVEVYFHEKFVRSTLYGSRDQGYYVDWGCGVLLLVYAICGKCINSNARPQEKFLEEQLNNLKESSSGLR